MPVVKQCNLSSLQGEKVRTVFKKGKKSITTQKKQKKKAKKKRPLPCKGIEPGRGRAPTRRWSLQCRGAAVRGAVGWTPSTLRPRRCNSTGNDRMNRMDVPCNHRGSNKFNVQIPQGPPKPAMAARCETEFTAQTLNTRTLQSAHN